MNLSNVINLLKNIEFYSLCLRTAESELTGIQRRTITIFTNFGLYTIASLILLAYLFEWNGNKIVIVHFIVIISFVIKMNLMFENIPIYFYIAIIFSSALFVVSAMIISKQIKDILLILKENKELIKTIQTILQVFPEGVMIRSFDQKTKEIILKFANDIARKLI